ncbi:MAG TPA: hypothetical protein PKK01_10265 [Mycobacterium sp.]|nr:MAG: hypothetical protein E6Q56_06360 [Mycobacterium sp.]HOB49681.1 hypothetical protein [Mycobacterium sp.]HPZ93891.1 hypothetical protein [Mycobacterium sp.]HQE15451.1 hypothetical protein [Mycobacterium sp.]
MFSQLRRQTEILHARIEIGKITVRSKAGGVEAVIPRGIFDDEVRVLGKAGYTLVHRGFPRVMADGRPYTILVRRRLAWFTGQRSRNI